MVAPLLASRQFCSAFRLTVVRGAGCLIRFRTMPAYIRGVSRRRGAVLAGRFQRHNQFGSPVNGRIYSSPYGSCSKGSSVWRCIANARYFSILIVDAGQRCRHQTLGWASCGSSPVRSVAMLGSILAGGDQHRRPAGSCPPCHSQSARLERRRGAVVSVADAILGGIYSRCLRLNHCRVSPPVAAGCTCLCPPVQCDECAGMRLKCASWSAKADHQC